MDILDENLVIICCFFVRPPLALNVEVLELPLQFIEAINYTYLLINGRK